MPTTTSPVAHATSTSTFGTDARGTAHEGVVIRTLDPDAQLTRLDTEVTIGFRNYAEAIDQAHQLRMADHQAGRKSWWLAFQAGDAAAHLDHYGYTVPAELAAIAAVPAR